MAAMHVGMMLAASKSPRALVYRISGGVLLLMSGFGVAALPWDRMSSAGHLLWLTSHRRPVPIFLLAVLWIVGLAVLWRAEFTLKAGIKKSIWPEEELTPLRRLTRTGAYLSFALLLAVRVCIVFVFSDSKGHGFALFPLFLIPFQTFIRLANILKQSEVSGSGVELSLRIGQPIRSEEWE